MPDETALTENLLIERMREVGLRLTLPRRAVVRALVESEDPFLSARMIIDHIMATAGQIEASTVYRVLDDLARIGLVHHVPLKGGSGRWHVTLHYDHEHLVCEFCGKTIAIPQSEFASLFDLFRSRYGFNINPHHFAFLGYCNECGPQSDHHHHP